MFKNIFEKKIMGSKYSSATIFYIFYTCMFMFTPKIGKMNPPKKTCFFFQVGGSSTTLEIYYTIHGG